MDSKYSIYCKKIAEINIDGEDLKYIENKNELQQWGIQKPAHKSKIWKEIQALISNNGQYVAAMQAEGNLVIYDLNKDNGKAIWWTDTITNIDNQYLILQNSDGNLVIYGDSGVRWASYKGNYIPSHLIMQGDGM